MHPIFHPIPSRLHRDRRGCYRLGDWSRVLQDQKRDQIRAGKIQEARQGDPTLHGGIFGTGDIDRREICAHL